MTYLGHIFPRLPTPFDHSNGVVIRTNGGELTIDASKDTVKHFGEADKVDVKAIFSSSYHENGTVKLIAVKEGHIMLEGDAEVNGVYVYTEDASAGFEDINISVESGVDVPKLSRSAVKIADDGTKVCTLVTDQAKDVYLFNEGIYEQIKTVDEGKPITDESATWADSSSNTANTQTAAQQLANEFNGSYDSSGKIADQEVVVSEGSSAGTYTVKFNEETREFETYQGETKVTEAAVVEAVAEVADVASEAGKTVEEAEAASALKGNGIETDPYLIYNLKDFQNCEALTETSSQVIYFKVMEDFTNDDNKTTSLYYVDLDLNGHTINLSSTSALLSIRNEVKIHDGTFNWVGGTTNIASVNQSETANVKATFENLTLTGKIITTSAHFGPIISYLYSASFKGTYELNANNVNNNLTIIDQNGDVGGLFGYVQGNKMSASITNCTFAGSAQGSNVGGFFNCTSYPEARPIVNSGNSVTGKLIASSNARAFGLNGNYDPIKPDSTKDSMAAQNALVDSTSGSLITLTESTTLLSIDSSTKAISVNAVEGASYYIVEIEYWVNRNADGSGGYPRTIQVRLDAAGDSGLKQLDFVQSNTEPSASATLLDFDAAKVWEEDGVYKIYDPYYTMYHSSTNWYVRAYAYDTNDTLKAYQTTKR